MERDGPSGRSCFTWNAFGGCPSRELSPAGEALGLVARRAAARERHVGSRPPRSGSGRRLRFTWNTMRGFAMRERVGATPKGTGGVRGGGSPSGTPGRDRTRRIMTPGPCSSTPRIATAEREQRPRDQERQGSPCRFERPPPPAGHGTRRLSTRRREPPTPTANYRRASTPTRRPPSLGPTQTSSPRPPANSLPAGRGCANVEPTGHADGKPRSANTSTAYRRAGGAGARPDQDPGKQRTAVIAETAPPPSKTPTQTQTVAMAPWRTRSPDAASSGAPDDSAAPSLGAFARTPSPSRPTSPHPVSAGSRAARASDRCLR